MDKIQYYSQLGEDTLKQMMNNLQEWQSFLVTSARLYKYSFPDQVMIYAQRPQATACAEYDIWNDKMKRYVKRGSKGIALMDTRFDTPRLRYVFDIADTGTRHHSKDIFLWKVEDKDINLIQEKLNDVFEIMNDDFEKQIWLISEKKVSEYWNEYHDMLIDILAQTDLSRYDEGEIERSFKEIAEKSINYALSTRCIETEKDYFKIDDFAKIQDFNTLEAATALGTAVTQITSQIFHEIEMSIKEAERLKKKERSQTNENRIELQTERRLSDSEYPVESDVHEPTREVRQNEKDISSGTQSATIQHFSDERNVVSTFDGSGSDSSSKIGNHDGRTVEEKSSSQQADRSISMGTAHEHAKGTSRRSDSKRTNQQLKFDLFLSEDEQIKRIDEAESKVENPKFSAFSFSDEEINHVLIYGSNKDHAHSLIVTEFMKQKSSAEIAEFVQEIYQGGFGIKEEKYDIAAWYDVEGIRLSKGSRARFNPFAQLIPWNEATERIQELLNVGLYATNVELVEAPNLERKQLAESIWYLYRDLSDEAKEKGYLSSLNTIKNKGFPDKTQQLADGLVDKDYRIKLTNELEAFITAYKENRDLMRFQFYKPSIILKKLKELELPRIEYSSDMMERPNIKFFITDDEIDNDIAHGSGVSGGKYRIYDYFTEAHSTTEKVEFLKKEYGIGGHSHALSSASGSGQEHNAKGIHYSKNACVEIHLTWHEVVNRIDDLILHDRYLNTEERALIEDEVISIDEKQDHYDNPIPITHGNNEEESPVVKEIPNNHFEDEHFTETSVESSGSDLNYQQDISTIKNDYSLGDQVYIEDTLFEITDLSDNTIQLLDPTLTYPVYRVENKENFERLLQSNSRNLHDKSKDVFPASNYQITDEHLGEGTPKVKFENNIQAIKTLYQLEKENRNASLEEQEILASYVGWGGLSEAFDSNKANWTQEYNELKALLSDDEYEAARASTLNAHYTSPAIIRAIYDAIKQFGFEKGNILEPSCGVGNFFGLLPESMRDSKLYGVELDSISGRIAKKLYPNANIIVAGFESTNQKDFYDIAIGNVPFGNYKVSDKPYDKLNFSIHNYFFAKALDQIRPKGILAFVTSRYTMDQKNPEVRKYLAKRAELLGAIRLPNNAFKANAGAEVVSDIIFLQKREYPIEIEPDWVHLGTTPENITINSYFIEHPEMVLGNLKLETTQYGIDSTVVPFEEGSLSQHLAEAIKRINGRYEPIERSIEESEQIQNTIPANPNVKNFSYGVIEGEVYFRENSIMRLMEVNEQTKERITGLVELRNIVNELMDYQLEDYPDEEIKIKQQELEHAYDEFTSRFGLINSKANEKAFCDDSSYYLLCSLENIDENGALKSKADMFYKRTIRPERKEIIIDTPSEALAISISDKGKVDLPYMAELMNKPNDYESMIKELQGIIFKDPLASESLYEGWQTSDEYLSGNVREKLKIAKLTAQKDPLFQVNVEALEKAQPKDLEASEIDVRLGATWIDKKYIQDFMYEIFEPPFYLRRYIEVDFSPITAEWRIQGKSVIGYNDVTANMTYGTDRANAYKILEDTLNLRDVRIYDKIEDEEGKEKRVLNKKETTLAQQKQQSIKDAFSDWIWKDVNRRQALVQTYNEKFNSIRPREYDGCHIRFVGMNPEIKMREHQRNAVAHALYGGNTLLAHEVGAGKTFEMAAIAMESKRLGLCQKSMFVVPNHLIMQWANEFLTLYPKANLLVATKKDFEKANRKKFCARIATGDYDAIIMGHSQFEKIPISAERQERLIQNQIEEIENALATIKQQNGEQFTIKQMEKTRKSLEARLDKLNDTERKDDVITFEQLGVDRLFVDESHAYKNLFLYTKMRNVAGLSTSEAQKSSDMFMKCQYMDELTGSRGIVFATGTPVSNSMTELYTVMRYLQYNTLKQKGLMHFDCWASTFGETTTAIELAPEGTGYRARTRFSKFFNLPELMNMFKEIADIKTSDQLKLPVPKAKFETIVVQPSEYQKKLVSELSKRAAAVHNKQVDPSVDNMLKITTDGRKIGLDQRLIDPYLPDNPDSKLNACVSKVMNIWREGKDERLTQLLFCDFSTPKKDDIFNVYDDIRTKLIAKGVPENEIAFIHTADTEAKKKELFSKVRNGQVRILMGSTQKMGAGTNVQDRLIAVHHLDVGWRPSDITQRNGRIIRQGNKNKEVQVYQYVTEGTFDAYLYQTLENKQKFISQIMTSKSPVRSCDDVDEQVLSYAEIKALCAGNPLIKEKMDLDIDVARLKVLKSDYLSQQHRLEDRLLKYYPSEIERQKSNIKGFEMDVITAEEHPQIKEGFCGIQVKGRFFDEKEIAGAAILDACKKIVGTEPNAIGSYRGFEMELYFDSFEQHFNLILKGNMSHIVTLGTDARGNLTRMDNCLANIPTRLDQARQLLSNLIEQQSAAQMELGKPFSQEQELKEKASRLSELDVKLNMETEEVVETKEENERSSVLADLRSKAEHLAPAKQLKGLEPVL